MNPDAEKLYRVCRRQRRIVAAAWPLLWFSFGLVAGTAIRPAAADGADELHRSRVALESIADTLKRCGR